jgi:hypothetical protein
VLARLDDVELSREERALIEKTARDYLEIMSLLEKPGVTMTEIRARLRIQVDREGG